MEAVPDALCIQYDFHSHFLGLKPTFLIKSQGAFVAAPHVQRDIVAALFPGEFKDRIVDRPSDMLSAFCLIHTEIVDVERFDIRQDVVV